MSAALERGLGETHVGHYRSYLAILFIRIRSQHFCAMIC